MKHFARLTIWLLLAAGALCVAVGVVGRVSTAHAGLGVAACNGLPCIHGIVAGHTRWQDAHQRLSAVDNAQLEEKTITLRSAADANATLYISVDHTNVGHIAIRPDGALTVGSLLDLYGTPCGVTIYRYSPMVTLRYPTLLANVQTTSRRLTPDTPLVAVQILDPAFKPKFQANVCVDNITDGARNYRWAGFASARFYASHRHLWQR